MNTYIENVAGDVQRWTVSKVGKIFMVILVVLAIAAFALTMVFSPEYSSFTAQIMKGAFGLTLFFLFDKYALKEVDTIEELRKGNLAWAIFLAIIGAIIIAGIVSS